MLAPAGVQAAGWTAQQRVDFVPAGEQPLRQKTPDQSSSSDHRDPHKAYARPTAVSEPAVQQPNGISASQLTSDAAPSWRGAPLFQKMHPYRGDEAAATSHTAEPGDLDRTERAGHRADRAPGQSRSEPFAQLDWPNEFPVSANRIAVGHTGNEVADRTQRRGFGGPRGPPFGWKQRRIVSVRGE
jgi:hypothetical protein